MPIIPETIYKVWLKYDRLCDVPDYISPRYGRAYFACQWCLGPHKKSIKGLQAILRHVNINATQFYLDKIIVYEDLRAEFYEGIDSPFADECARFISCPLSIQGCKCARFIPITEKLTV
jgi:integrase